MFDVISKLLMQIHEILASTKRWSKFFIYFEMKFPREKILKIFKILKRILHLHEVRIIIIIFYRKNSQKCA